MRIDAQITNWPAAIVWFIAFFALAYRWIVPPSRRLPKGLLWGAKTGSIEERAVHQFWLGIAKVFLAAGVLWLIADALF